MNPYFKTNYSDWQAQIEKELKGQKSFDEFIKIPWFNAPLKRYYTADEHREISDFSKKLSYASSIKSDTEFRNFYSPSENASTLSALQSGAYNGLYLNEGFNPKSIEKEIQLGYLKSICSPEFNTDLLSPLNFEKQGDHACTLVRKDNNASPKSFERIGCYTALNAAECGAYVDSELAIFLWEAEILIDKYGANSVAALLALSHENWLEANAKLRLVKYLWMSLLSIKGLSSKTALDSTVVSNQNWLTQQDQYNFLLRQNLHAFHALSHKTDGIIIPPFENSKVGQHSSGRLVPLLTSESDIDLSEDPLHGNYILDFASFYLADAVWKKFQELRQSAHALQIIDTWISEDLEQLKLKGKTFVGLNLFEPQDGEKKTLNFDKSNSEKLSFI